MKIDLNEIDKFDVFNFDDSFWNYVLKNIDELYNTTFNENELNKYLKENIKINFSFFRNIDNEPNAFVEKINEKEYNIVLGKKLIILLMQHAYKVIDENYIYSDLNRKQIDLMHNIAQDCFYLWIDFICLHELSHICRSHFKDNGKYFKFNKEVDENHNNIFYEIDADRFAMILATKRFSAMIYNIKKTINKNDKEIIKNYLISMTYLFDLFFLIEGENKSSGHPSPLQRISFVLTAFCESIKDENLFQVELDSLADSVYKEFVLKHSEEYEPNNNYGEFAKESQILLEQYNEFLKKTKLNENQLFK